MLAATAIATRSIRYDVIDKLDMVGCEVVRVSPDRPNMYYEVHPRTGIENDMEHLIKQLKEHGPKANRVIVYCKSLNMCSELYTYFHYTMGNATYYPPESKQVSDNRLFGMYHANTPSHNKEVILESMQKENGIVRVVFATMALGMGVNFYGAQHSVPLWSPKKYR